jgi:hypothetical protein
MATIDKKKLWTHDQRDAETSTLQQANSQQTNFNASAAEYDLALPTSEELQTQALEGLVLGSAFFV